MKTPKKFLNTTPKKDDEVASINFDFKKVLIKITTVGLILGFVGANLYVVGNKLYIAKDAIQFAYNHPEMVDPLKVQYEEEFQSLQDSFAKRQGIVTPSGEDSPKE